AGINHLLPGGRGAGGNEGEEADELQVACFMGLLSFLASRPEVVRISAAREAKLLNAAAYRNLQSATLTETPMTDSGLDGTGEVIQVVDTGLDYNSCYFVDEDGEEVAHGHYFEEASLRFLGVEADALSSWYPTFDYNPQLAQVFTGGDFNFDLGRRKIVQYISLIRQDAVATNSSSSNTTATNSTSDPANPYGASWATSLGDQYRWVGTSDFAEDYPGGHGTHTAGSAAGAVVGSPPPVANAGNGTVITEICEEGRNLSCVGGCIDILDPYGDDLVRADRRTASWAG
ncbi:unnamed protein product, partial [Hapterophycus canaliculatus]